MFNYSNYKLVNMVFTSFEVSLCNVYLSYEIEYFIIVNDK